MNIGTSLALLSSCLCMSQASASLNFSATLLDAPGPQGPLKGTLLTPNSKPTAVVIIVPGSGPTDRDGNNPLGVKASSYRLLSEGLASKGIATLRIDKRGMFASSMAVENPNAVKIADYVDDVRAWVKVIRRELPTPCVWILGHSEGGLVALASAQDVAVCGVMLVATPGRPMGEVLRAQFKANPANDFLLKEALPIIDALEHRRHVDTTKSHPSLQNIFHPAVQAFLIDAFAYHPAHLISAISKPVLVLQGQRDLQVEDIDAIRLKTANPQASLVLLPDMNHVMKEVTTGDIKENMSSYADPALPLAPGLIDAIVRFVSQHSR